MDGLKKIGLAFKSLKWYEIVMCIIMLAISIYYAVCPQDNTPQWLAIVNFISGLCGIICVFFAAKANRMNFPFAVVNTISFMIFLGYFGIWATFWLETLVYFPMNIISWIAWYRHQDRDNNLLAQSKRLRGWQHLVVISVTSALTAAVFYTLSALAGDTWMNFAKEFGWNAELMKWLDSAIFAIGIMAISLQALRYRDQFILWLINDAIALAQYALKQDPVYITKKTIYLIEAIIGFINWNNLAKKDSLAQTK